MVKEADVEPDALSCPFSLPSSPLHEVIVGLVRRMLVLVVDVAELEDVVVSDELVEVAGLVEVVAVVDATVVMLLVCICWTGEACVMAWVSIRKALAPASRAKIRTDVTASFCCIGPSLLRTENKR